MALVKTCDLTSTEQKPVIASTTESMVWGDDKYTWDLSEKGQEKLAAATAKYDDLMETAEAEMQKLQAELDARRATVLLDVLAKSGLQALLDKAETSSVVPEPKDHPKAKAGKGGMSKNQVDKLNKERNGRIRAWAADSKNWDGGPAAPGKFPNALIEAYQKANPNDLPVVG